MRTTLIILYFFFHTSFAMADQFGKKTYERVFYCVYQNNQCVDSETPRSIGPDQIFGYIRDITEHPENFIGFTDSYDTTLQFYVEELDKIWIEVPSPADRGSFGKHVSNEEMIQIVAGLSEPYDRYIKELKLEFNKW